MTGGRHDMKLMVAFVAFWAAEEVLTLQLLGRYGLVQIVWLRFLLHLLVLWGASALWAPRNDASLWRTQRPGFQLIRASMLTGMPAFWVMGVRSEVSPAMSMSVFWVAPLLILMFAQVLLGERAPRRVWLATALSSAGVFALTGPHEAPRPQLLWFPLGVAVCFSLYVVMTRSLRGASTRVNLFYSGLGVCLMLAPLIPSRWVTPGVPDLIVHVAVTLLGLGSLLALERLTAAAPVSYSAPLIFLQVPFAGGFAWCLEQYDPTLRTLIGLLAIGTAVFYVWQQQPWRGIGSGRFKVAGGPG